MLSIQIHCSDKQFDPKKVTILVADSCQIPATQQETVNHTDIMPVSYCSISDENKYRFCADSCLGNDKALYFKLLKILLSVQKCHTLHYFWQQTCLSFFPNDHAEISSIPQLKLSVLKIFIQCKTKHVHNKTNHTLKVQHL